MKKFLPFVAIILIFILLGLLYGGYSTTDIGSTVLIGSISSILGALLAALLEKRLDATVIENALLKTIKRNNKKRSRDLAISITYLSSIKDSMFKAKISLIISFVILSIIIPLFIIPSLIYLLVVPVSLYFIITLKLHILEYRVVNGYFGENSYESKLLINFIVENSNDIDFTNGNGKPMKALLSRTSGKTDSQAEEGVFI